MSKYLLKSVFKIGFKNLKFISIYFGVILIFFYAIYISSRVQNERIRIKPKIFLWSHLAKPEDNECRLPLDIDPWDQSIRQYLNTSIPRRVVCPQENSTHEWTQTDENGILRKNCSQCLCKFWVYRRREGNDRKVDWMDNGIIDDRGIDLNAINLKKRNENRFVYVECEDIQSGQKYVNHHFWFVPSNKTTGNRSTTRPSVLILVIESLSRLNYLRHMQLTKQSFDSLGNVFYLRGLTKMADNSFPNMIPFLTGQSVDHFGGQLMKGPFDDYPFIWKNFSDKGFQTALIEDEYEITLFNEWEVGRKGFVREQPVDWYTFPFWMQIDKTDRTKLGRFDAKCYRDRRPRLDIFLDQLKHFVNQCHRRSLPFLGFSFFIQATHVRFNQARTIDGHYSQLLRQLKDILKDHFVILMGDHGCRFSQEGFLYTAVGRIEERMPLFGIHIPESILSRNQHLSEYLLQNRDRLTTWLDIHRMLEDIVNEDFTAFKGDHYNMDSYSLWRQTVPENRTCAEALIPQMYCVCDKRRRLKTSDLEVKEVAIVLIEKINDILPEMCHKLSLRVLISAEEITFPAAVRSKSMPNVTHLYELTAELNPSSAIIRSQIHFFANHTIKLDEEVSRLNPYGNQSHCVSDPNLKKICFCK